MRKIRSLKLSWMLIATATFAAPAEAAITVLQPNGTDNVVTAGEDFATQVLGNAWDMNDADLHVSESSGMANQAFAVGVFAGDSSNADPWLVPLFQGFAGTVKVNDGDRFPVDTARFRYLTLKLRLSASQPVYAFFYSNDPLHLGNAYLGTVPAGAWSIVGADLGAIADWTAVPRQNGLRLDPAVAEGVRIEIDWIRLTAAPASATTKSPVSWIDTGSGPYTIAAIDADDVAFTIATGVSTTSYIADFSRLPPGSYRVEVRRSGSTARSPGTVRVNAPPVILPLQPNARGDQARNVAQEQFGNPWGPMDAADVASTPNLTGVSYANPSGTLSGRPTSNDPAVIFNLHNQTIDADRYRSLCFTLQVQGLRDIGAGSVARLFWQRVGQDFSVTEDIVVEQGLNEYCFADLAEVPREAVGFVEAWGGSVQMLRLDPHEFPVPAGCNASPQQCRDIRLDTFTLSPWFEADPRFTFRWNLSDADADAMVLRVYLDPDRDEDNGNERLLGESYPAAGTGEAVFAMPPGTPLGRYNVLMIADDGRNPVRQYAAGPLLVRSTGSSDPIFADGFEL